ncbi:MAG: hypothetical protein V1748_07545 [Actinomycetota bacterium]
MSQLELLKKVVDTLDEAGIEYMLTGAMVSAAQGVPRLTHDIDVVVDLRENDAGSLLNAFKQPDYYLSEESIRQGLADRGSFNLVEPSTGNKVDFWLLTDEPFDRSRFSRRYREEFRGVGLEVSSPEDTILMKLKWADELGGSEKQFIDALRVYELQFEVIEQEYLSTWAEHLGISRSLDRVRTEAKPVRG